MDHAGMTLGLLTPIVTKLGPSSKHWTQTAGIEELVQLTQAADRLGFSHVTCSEHVFIVGAEADRRGTTYWDPLATFGYLAALTERIRFETHVLVLGYHHPLEIAKRYGTLDMISGGRVILGVGVGSLKEEFDVLGVPFDDRGARADDALRCLRTCLSTSRVSYDGPYYEFDDVIIEPHAVQERVPIWIGGRTRRSLRRAIEHGDGWAPFGLTLADIESMLASVDAPAELDVIMGTDKAIDPIGAPAEAEDALAQAAAAGVTICSPPIRSRSVEHHVEQLEALAT